MIVIWSQRWQSEGEEGRHLCAVDRTSCRLTSISETGCGPRGGLSSRQFLFSSRVHSNELIIKSPTPDPVDLHCSGLGPVWDLTSSLCPPWLHNSSQRCFVTRKKKKKLYSLLSFMSSRILINKRWWLLRCSCLCRPVLWAANQRGRRRLSRLQRVGCCFLGLRGPSAPLIPL